MYYSYNYLLFNYNQGTCNYLSCANGQTLIIVISKFLIFTLSRGVESGKRVFLFPYPKIMLSASPGPVSVLICPATPRVLRFRLSSEKCSEISYDWSLILKFPIFHCFHFYCPPGAGFFLICLYLRSSIELLGQRDQRKLKP